MFTKAPQGLIYQKGITVLERTVSSNVLSISYGCLSQNIFHNLFIDPVVPLGKHIDNTFGRCPSASPPVPCGDKVRLIHLNLTRQFSLFELRDIKQNNPQLLGLGKIFPIQTQIAGQAMRSLLLKKTLQMNLNFTMQLRQALLFQTRHAFYVAASGFDGRKNIIKTIQKLGCTTKNSTIPNRFICLQRYNDLKMPYLS